jgi:thioredoxin reductase (NADPH)
LWRWLIAPGASCSTARALFKTGPDHSSEELTGAHWPRSRRLDLLETSLPGVFAAGDVRAGNVKRVASSVGEGLIAISFVHQLLREYLPFLDARDQISAMESMLA